MSSRQHTQQQQQQQLADQGSWPGSCHASQARRPPPRPLQPGKSVAVLLCSLVRKKAEPALAGLAVVAQLGAIPRRVQPVFKHVVRKRAAVAT